MKSLLTLTVLLAGAVTAEACGRGSGAGLFHRHKARVAARHSVALVTTGCAQYGVPQPAAPLPMPQLAPPQAPKPATKTTTTTTVVEEVPVAPPVARVGYAASVIVAAPVYVRSAPAVTVTRSRTFSRVSSGDVGFVRGIIGLPFGCSFR